MYCFNLITRSSQFCDNEGIEMEHFASYQLSGLIMGTLSNFEPVLLAFGKSVE